MSRLTNEETQEQAQAMLDRFAAAALTGFLAGHAGAEVAFPPEDAAATRAYKYAQAMMHERNRRDCYGSPLPQSKPLDEVDEEGDAE